MAILKLEAFSGLSGDMFLGLLADLAMAHDDIIKLPHLLHLEEELQVKITDVVKTGLACKHIKIIDLQEHHRHHDGHQHHHHRHLKDVYAILDKSSLTTQAKEIAKQTFLLLAEAEAEVHGTTIEKIHFHEVGAIDSIADVAGTALLLDKLNITQTFATPITTGYGFVNTEHGRLPVPAPATQKLLAGFPTESGENKSEMVTPTGAAILKYLNPEFNLPVLSELKIGYGPGEKDFPIPTVLRGSLCKPLEKSETIYQVECNLDDETPEHLGYDFQQALLNKGALDIFITPTLMKKGRSGLILQILVKELDLGQLTDFILEMTTGIGLRYFPVHRKELERKMRALETEWGMVKVKEVVLPSGKKSIKPENDEIMRIALEQNLLPNDIIVKVLHEYHKLKH